MKALFTNWRRAIADSILRRMVANELLKQLAKKGVEPCLGSVAISRLVVEIVDHAQGASHDSAENAGREVLKQAEKIATEVAAYFSETEACDPAVRRILDFHIDSCRMASFSSGARRLGEVGDLLGQDEGDSASRSNKGPSLSHVVAILGVGFAISAAVVAIVSAVRR